MNKTPFRGWWPTTANLTCLEARLKGRLTRRSPGCHLRCAFEVRGCLRGFQLSVYPPRARWGACRSVASFAAKRDSSVLEGFSQCESQKAPRHLPRLAAAAEPQSTEANQIFPSVCHRDEPRTPERGWFQPWKQPAYVTVPVQRLCSKKNDNIRKTCCWWFSKGAEIQEAWRWKKPIKYLLCCSSLCDSSEIMNTNW